MYARNGNATTTYRIRVVPLEGKPWFVATDVCRALGLTLAGGSTRHLTNLNPIDVRRGRVDTGPQGGRPNALISEAGLYKLIARSNKPEARAFKDWVFGEVLPTIRKTGAPLRRTATSLRAPTGQPWTQYLGDHKTTALRRSHHIRMIRVAGPGKALTEHLPRSTPATR